MGCDSPDDHDYYEVLGIDPEANDAELRRAWRQLALRWHPDRAGPDTTHIFQKLLAVYAVVSDPVERAEYDRRRGTSATPVETQPRRRPPGVLLQRLSRTLDILLACGTARLAEGAVIELFLDAEEASEGGMATIPMNVPVPCPACAANPEGPCATCGTERTVEERFSAWLSVPPGVADGAVLTPSVLLPGMRPVAFRVRLA